MVDKQKIIRMTAELEKFVRTFPNIFILPETMSANVFSLIKHLNTNIVAIIANAPNPQRNVVRMPSGEYPLINFPTALSIFDYRTAIVISAAKSSDNYILPVEFNIGDTKKLEIPAFALTDEEAQMIYNRMIMIDVLQQYQKDGISYDARNVAYRFARGIYTFLDSQFQDAKVSFWDRRNFVIPSYHEVDDTAIVLQGPIEYKDNYTITTVRLYRQWYPNAPIVISTWKNEATENFREDCRKIGVVLLENDLPAEPGWGHVNYQLESSLKGVEYVKENTSAKFVFKGRTDNRINRIDFLIYFKNLLNMFPPRDNKLKQRIILLSQDKWSPFYMRDYIFFGAVEDMINFFGEPRQNASAKEYINQNKDNYIHNIVLRLRRFRLFQKLPFKYNKNVQMVNLMNNYEAADTYIPKRFYEKYIAPVDRSNPLKSYWKFIRDYVIAVGEHELDFDWPKYLGTVNGTDMVEDVLSTYHSDLDFGRWLDIYLNYKDEDEL